MRLLTPHYNSQTPYFLFNSNISNVKFKNVHIQMITIAPNIAYYYLSKNKNLNQETVSQCELAISKDAHYSYKHARFNLRDRFLLGETAIKNSSLYDLSYLIYVLQPLTLKDFYK